MSNIDKCLKCRYCEPDGIGFSSVAECMDLKEPCDTAIIYCKE